MSPLQCADCGRDVSPLATTCPRCGHRLSRTSVSGAGADTRRHLLDVRSTGPWAPGTPAQLVAAGLGLFALARVLLPSLVQPLMRADHVLTGRVVGAALEATGWLGLLLALLGIVVLGVEIGVRTALGRLDSVRVSSESVDARAPRL